jgi:hypothetical protein
LLYRAKRVFDRLAALIEDVGALRYAGWHSVQYGLVLKPRSTGNQFRSVYGAGCTKIYREKVTVTRADRRQLLDVLKHLAPGDTVNRDAHRPPRTQHL